MKILRNLLLLLLVFSLSLGILSGCVTPDNGDGKGENEGEGGEKPAPGSKEEEWTNSYNVVTISEALTFIGNKYIIAEVKSVDDPQKGKLTVKDKTGEMQIGMTYSSDGALRYDAMEDKPLAGDTVLLNVTLVKNGEETVAQLALITDFYHIDENKPVEEIKPGDTITVAEALELAGTTGVDDRFYIEATVMSITRAEYGAMIIADETGEISVYNSKNADGTVDYAQMEDKPYKGDTVRVYCTLQDYNGTKEIKSAWIISFTHNELDVNESNYTAATVAEARAAAKDSLLKVTGVVSRITYAFGMVPSGFYLIDGTASIYVYDGDLAARVVAGNTVTLLGKKDYWILDTETNNAGKFGYKGCNQLTECYSVSISDTADAAVDLSWCEESTVKQIIDTPVTTDISSLIFKVNALVKKVEGKGFVNYYFYDLDGTTGAYTYTQCSGSDFAWLDEFDGKICTVYLSALNAKSTSSDCFWRFIPVEVKDEGFSFDLKDAAEHAVKYYGVTHFLPTYTGDPALELLTSVSSELLGFENVPLSYTSSSTDVITFTVEDGKTVMHVVGEGTAVITVSSTFDGVTYSEDVEIRVLPVAAADSVTVKEAIDAAVGETVVVKGIVGPSLVNQSGFYLIDETGVIAVLMDSATLATLEPGYEVILEGTRHRKINDTASTKAGQICLKDTTVVANLYGKHEYSTNTFTELTPEEFKNLDVTKDYSTNVYKMTVVIEYIEAQYYTSIKLKSVDGATSLSLYSSSADQYSWLLDFGSEPVTIEIAACNWNDKTYYVGCVLAVYNEDGTKTINTLNFNY